MFSPIYVSDYYMGGFLTSGVEGDHSHTRWRIKVTFHTSSAHVVPACFGQWAEIEMCQCQMNKRSESERGRGQLRPNTERMRAEQRSDLEDDITQFYDDVVTLILKSQRS